MKSLACLALLVLINVSPSVSGQAKALDRMPTGAVEVELPVWDVRVSYVESAKGMILILESKEVTVSGKRLYIGDGKVAAAFVASDQGFNTPIGPVNAAAIDYKQGTVLEVPQDKLEKWAARSGEVYLLTPGIELKPKKTPADTGKK